MADISNVHHSEIKDIFDSLESLSCKSFLYPQKTKLTQRSPHLDTRTVLILLYWR
jgi:hypothetical protein